MQKDISQIVTNLAKNVNGHHEEIVKAYLVNILQVDQNTATKYLTGYGSAEVHVHLRLAGFAPYKPNPEQFWKSIEKIPRLSTHNLNGTLDNPAYAELFISSIPVAPQSTLSKLVTEIN